MKILYSIRYLIKRIRFKHFLHSYRGSMFYIANEILKDEVLAEEALYQAYSVSIPYLDLFLSKNTVDSRGFLLLIVKYTALNLQKENLSFNDLSQISQSFPEKEIVYQDVLILNVLYKLKTKEIAKLLHLTNEVVEEASQYANSYIKTMLSNSDHTEVSYKTHD